MNVENHIKSARQDQENLDIIISNVRHLNTSSHSFAESMLNQINEHGFLSEKQWYWMDVLAQRCIDNAKEYGQRTGKCMFCRRLLTATNSITVGYGPICAERNHLPWG